MLDVRLVRETARRDTDNETSNSDNTHSAKQSDRRADFLRNPAGVHRQMTTNGRDETSRRRATKGKR